MTKINCLDHGFVKLLNISGAIPREPTEGHPFNSRDIDPAKCARISFDNFEQTRTEEQDLKLVDYLLRNRHNTPIEMTEIWLEMKLPIFVARQFVRHRTACINEVSARYVQLPEEFYIPDIVGSTPNNGAKQGQGNTLDIDTQKKFKRDLIRACSSSYSLYNEYIQKGVAPEHARMFLHVNHYTHWVWKQDLSNLRHFLSLRLHEHAQLEARIYAQAIQKLLYQYLPHSVNIVT